MNGAKSKILKLFQKKIVFVLSMIVIVVICMTFLLYSVVSKDSERSLIVNSLGKQRMLTQTIAKNANYRYSLMQSMQMKNNNESDEVLRGNLEKSKQDLLKEALEFENTLKSTRLSYIVIDGRKLDFSDSKEAIGLYLDDTDEIWNGFKKSVEILTSNTTNTYEVNQAVKYINDNNEKLMEYCNEITQAALVEAKGKTMKVMVFSGFMFAVALAALSISVFSLYKYIIVPLNSFYKGIAEIGTASMMDFDVHIPTSRELEPVINDINSSLTKLGRIFTLIENINSNISFREVLDYIYKTFSAFIPYCYIGIALIKDGGKTLEASYGISDGTVAGLPQNLLGIKTDIHGTSLLKVIETGEARVINDLEKYVNGKIIKDYTSVIMKAGINSSITLPLKVNNHPVGIIFFSSREKNSYTKEHVEFLKTLANSIAISFEKNIFVDDLIYSSILALAKLAEARDEDTGEHIERMKNYSRLISQLLYDNGVYGEHINSEFINDMEKFSPMHDIGKVGIRDSILLKPHKLTDEEFEEMKFHTVYGARVLKAAEDNMRQSGRSIFKLGIEIAEFHHEKWNGKGYPKGLKGEEIPLSARIVAVADVFDALTSERPYKKPFPFEQSVNIIAEGRGSHFDPGIIDVFLQNKDRIFELYSEFNNI